MLTIECGFQSLSQKLSGVLTKVSMFVKTVLEWSYTPPGIFEAPYVFPSQDFELRIESGLASATFNQPRQQVDQIEKLEIERFVRLAFRGLEAITHQHIEITGDKVYQYDAEGQRHEFIFLSGAICGGSALSGDIVVRDKDGTIICDSRAERIQKKHEFVTCVLNHAPDDGLLRLLLKSYAAAISDPANEFVHLYEIRDALKAHFGGEVKAKKVLDFSDARWSKLGRLANNEAVEQSRHRGSFINSTRSATIEELTEARQIAQEMIEKYIATLKT